MRIIGIDPSLCATGHYATWDRIAGTIRPVHPSGMERLREIARRVANVTEGADLVVVEGIAMMARGNITELAGLHWLIRDRLDKEPLIVAPSQLKKFVLGTGKGEKSLMLREVYKRWNIDAADDNQADAAGLAMIGRAYLDPALCENQAQREVIAALKAGPKAKGKKAA